MADSPDDGEAVDEDLPDAVQEWLGSLAAERGVSEAELLGMLLGEGADGTAGAGGGGVDPAELERVEREFQELVEDVRDRVIQVKREADEKAPADHSHHDLRTSVEQLSGEVAALESEVEGLHERLAGGFENYEEILTYLTETTDSLDRKLGRLAAAVIDLRDVVGDAARDEVRRTALSHLTETANRHGVEKAKCQECGEAVHVGMLVEPQCPHCASSFSALEPKRGFFRSSVLHTGTMPALEAGEAPEAEPDSLEAVVEDAAAGGGGAPSFELDELSGPSSGPADGRRAPERESEGDAAEATGNGDEGTDEGDEVVDDGDEATGDIDEVTDDGGEVVDDGDEATDDIGEVTGDGEEATDVVDEVTGDGEEATDDFDEMAGDGDEATPAAGSSGADGDDRAATSAEGGPETDGRHALERVDGIGAAYADRLTDAGVDGLPALAVADPEQLGEAIDVPATTVADWVEQADAMTGS